MDKNTLIWEIIDIGSGIKYKTLNPRNFQELGYGLNNDVLQCNPNTLIKTEVQSQKLWDSLFS